MIAKPGSVVVLGTGTILGQDYTRRFEQELLGATKILTNIIEPAERWLPQSVRQREVECVRGLYSNPLQRIDNYARVAGHVVAAAREGGGVAFVTYGSPVVYDRVVSMIRELCVQDGLLCRVIPAVNSIDSMMAMLGLDMAPGLQMCEARWLVQNRIRIEPRLATLLFQVGFFWTDGIPQPGDLQASHLALLGEYLLDFYPASHIGVFVRAPGFAGDSGYIRKEALGRIHLGTVEDLSDTSFYIPPTGGPPTPVVAVSRECLEGEAEDADLELPWRQ
jgi:hypothetical protein